MHIRPLPSDSTTHTVPVSATSEVGPADTATSASRNLRAQVPARRLGQRARLVAELVQLQRAQEQLADLGAVEVDRRHEDVRRAVVGRAARSAPPGRSPGLDPAGRRGVVEPGLVGRQRLDLDELACAGGGGDARRRSRLASSASRAQCTWPPPAWTARLELLEIAVEVAQRALLDRAARLAQLLPVRAAPRPPPARLARMVVVALPMLRRSCESAERGAGGLREARGIARLMLRRPPGSRRGARRARRCEGATAHRRCASGTSCLPRSTTSARVSRTWRSLSASMAVETSAFLTAKVPPNPQHSCAPRQLDEVDAADRAQQPQRRVADAEHASEWQVGW